MDVQVREQLELRIAEIERNWETPPPRAAAEVASPALAEDEQLPLREPFGTWLLEQQDRGDWIDDLAAAARADRRFPRRGAPDDVRDHLRLLGADGDAFAQVDDAEACWLSL